MRPKGHTRQKIPLLAGLLVLWMAACALTQAAAPGEATSLATPPPELVRYQVDAYYPPYTFENDRFLYGFDPYLTNIIFTSDKYKLSYSTDTWDNVYRRLVNGEIDLAGIIAVTEERQKEVLFTDPLFNSYVGLYTEKNHAAVTLDDLPTLRVGVGKGYYTESILRYTLGIADYHAYADIGAALDDLQTGQIDVIFENQQYMDNILIQRSLKGSIVAQVTNLYPRPHAYAISKQRPALVAYMNERIRKLKQSGFFEEIYLKYFYAHSDGYVAEQNQRTAYFVGIGIAVVLGLFTIMQFMIRRLRRNLSASIGKTEAANAELARANAELTARYGELHAIAYTNAVTGLPNKNAFREAVRGMIESGKYENFGILYLDLDNFKDVNDTFGHDIGDKVLRAVAACLQNCNIPVRSLYNIGSDEFAIVMTSAPLAQDEMHVQAILQAIEQPVCIDGSVFHITASMGVVCYPVHGQTYEALLKNADAAMYRAKGNGRGMYVFFDETIGNAVQEHTHLHNSLREALARDEFQLYYQPQICTDNNALYGFEALLRWNRPGVGVVAPGAFIREAEESRLIAPIGQWVLESACRFIRRINEARGARYLVAVNVSIIQLLRDDYVETVLRTLRETGVEANLLELEITESCLLVETELVIGKLRQLSAAGVHIALDDFGTGYSSLRYLKDLPVHVLKIDRYFVASIMSEKSRSLVNAIVSIGHALGMALVAEGVENSVQRAVAGELKCDRLQGYMISRPMPEENVLTYIQECEGKDACAIADGISEAPSAKT